MNDKYRKLKLICFNRRLNRENAMKRNTISKYNYSNQIHKQTKIKTPYLLQGVINQKGYHF